MTTMTDTAGDYNVGTMFLWSGHLAVSVGMMGSILCRWETMENPLGQTSQPLVSSHQLRKYFPLPQTKNSPRRSGSLKFCISMSLLDL